MKLSRIVITGKDVQGQPFKVVGHINERGICERLIVDRYDVPYRHLHIFTVPVSQVLKFEHSELGYFQFPCSTFVELAKMRDSHISGQKNKAFESAEYLFNRFKKEK